MKSFQDSQDFHVSVASGLCQLLVLHVKGILKQGSLPQEISASQVVGSFVSDRFHLQFTHQWSVLVF